MKVPLLDPSKGNAPFLEELKDTAFRVIASGKYILGEEVELFEKEAAAYLQVKHAIGVSSGTDALLIALMALEISPGDEVICPSFTFFATAGAITRAGGTPVFADIEHSSFNVAPQSIEGLISPRTKGIIPVHLYGQSCDIDAVTNIAKKYNLFVIEDCAQAIGTEFNNQKVGTFGDFGIFSFFPSKNLGGFGDAGLVVTNDDNLMQRVKELRVHGGLAQYRHERVGGNFRIDALQAALLRVKLKHLLSFQKSRIRHSEIYNDLLLNYPYQLPREVYGRHTFNQFTIRVPNKKRDELQKYLASLEISSSIYYPIPLHKQECFRGLPSFYGSLKETEETCLECLSLPIAPELEDIEIAFVAESLRNFNL